jgi:hypothetical protein
MKNNVFLSATIMILASLSGYGQKIELQKLQDNLYGNAQELPSVDSLKKSVEAITKNFSKDSIHKQVNHLYYGDPTTVFHIGWEDGRVPEFSNAYTLQRHEFRLNILGRSSYAINNRLEVSSYLPLIMTPNVSLKYRFFDQGNFASAFEVGTAAGAFPVAFATGILLPGVVIGVGAAGFVKGSDNHLKLYSSWHPTQKLTFSARGSISFLKIGYTGIAAFAGLGGDGAAVGFIPVNLNHRFNYLMGGFETDYVINKKNVIVLNSSISGFEGGKKQLIIPSIAWTHAKTHVHYTLGLYTFLDPPSWEMWKTGNSQIPVGVYGNIYWIFNNRIKK